MTLTGKGKIAGVVGWPIGHSLSPVLHGYWLQELKLDGALVPLAVRREEFAQTIVSLQRAGFRGINVTVPHKEAAFALAHDCDEAARAASAANLLIFHADGRIEARNTDAVGLMESIRADMGGLDSRSVLLLGAGGAARGAILALNALGVAHIQLLNRHADKAAMLRRAMQPLVKSELAAGGLEDWKSAAPHADLIVNSTSAGMKGNSPLVLDLGLLKRSAVVLDIVYNPLETPLLRDAKAHGHQTIDGLGMLMHQAAPSFEAFFGVKPDVTPGLRARLIEALAHG
jgi:shikimate dehydrogenase